MAPLVRTGGSRHTGQAAPPHRNIHVDMNTLEAGHEFEELPDSYVIFITRGDVLGLGLPVGHIGRRIEEVDQDFGDGSHIYICECSDAG